MLTNMIIPLQTYILEGLTEMPTINIRYRWMMYGLLGQMDPDPWLADCRGGGSTTGSATKDKLQGNQRRLLKDDFLLRLQRKVLFYWHIKKICYIRKYRNTSIVTLKGYTCCTVGRNYLKSIDEHIIAIPKSIPGTVLWVTQPPLKHPLSVGWLMFFPAQLKCR
jgi:hypothetical protein